jgi:hypothetical protein
MAFVVALSAGSLIFFGTSAEGVAQEAVPDAGVVSDAEAVSDSEAAPEAVPAEDAVPEPAAEAESVRTHVAKPSVKREPAQQQERDAVEALIRGHVEHCNQRDLAAFLDDFVDIRLEDGMLQRYAERVFALTAFRLEIVDLKLSSVRAKRGNASLLLRAYWLDPSGVEASALSELVVRVSKVDGRWRIESTGRARLDQSDAGATASQP